MAGSGRGALARPGLRSDAWEWEVCASMGVVTAAITRAVCSG